MKVVVIELETEQEEKKLEEFLKIFAIKEISTYNANNVEKNVDETRVRKISNILDELGIPFKKKGYRYIRDIINILIERPTMLDKGITNLYREVALNYGTKYVNVERTIEHAIVNIWEKENGKQTINSILRCNFTKKPTNSEFIVKIFDNFMLTEQ